MMLERALKVKPNSAIARLNFGILHRNIGQLVQADYYFKRSIKLDAKYAEPLKERAITLYYLGRYLSTKRLYDRAIKLAPNDVLLYNNYGIYLKEIGNKTERRKIYSNSSKNWLKYENLISDSLKNLTIEGV